MQTVKSGSTRHRNSGHPEKIFCFLKDASKDDFTNLICALLTMIVFCFALRQLQLSEIY